MELFNKMVSLQLVLFFLTAIGFIINKANILKAADRKCISNILIDLMLPACIIDAFLGIEEFTPELMGNCVVIFAIGVITELLGIFFGGIIFKMYKKDWRNIMHYGIIVSNTAYIGLPVAGALFGDIGLLYASVYSIPCEIAMWTYALSLFKNDKQENVVKMVLSSPAADAVLIGLVILIFKIRFPAFISDGISYIGSCTTPVSMLVIGSILADGDLKKIFMIPPAYFSLVRLIVFPLILLVPMKLLGLDRTVVGIGLVMAAMPAAAATSILADKYDSDAEFATDVVILSTLLSMITIPVMMLLV